MNKKSFVFLVPPILFLIIILLVLAVLFLPQSPFKLAITQDPLTQLKQEYNTYDAISENWDCSGKGGATFDGNIIIMTGGGNKFDPPITPQTCTTKENFKGKTVVIMGTGSGTDVTAKGGTTGGCSWTGGGASCSTIFGKSTTTCNTAFTVLQPNTFDLNIYDVKPQGGITTSQITVGDEFHPSVIATVSGTLGARFVCEILFVGTKSRTCDIRDNEVWIQEKWSTPVNIEDLRYTATQFCATARPFTLRTLGVGEEAIFPNPIPAFNRGETIPKDRIVTADEIIIINYATPISECQSTGCRKCGLGESNVLENGVLTCKNFLREDEPRTIIEREIVVPKGKNIFTFTSSNEKSSFKIGDKTFNSNNQFVCISLEDAIYRPPNPSVSCYKARYSYNSLIDTIDDGEITHLSDFINFQYFAAGTFVKRTTSPSDNKLVGVHIFQVNRPLELTFKGIDTDKNTLLLDITNNLPTNTILIKSRQRALRAEINLPETQQEVLISTGVSSIEIPFNIENTGLNEVTISTFYPIEADAKTFMIGEGFKFGFESIITEGEIRIVIREQETIEPLKEPSFFMKIINRIIAFFKNLF